MASGSLSIGTLSGQIELDDKFTATIHLSNDAIDELVKRFDSANKSVVAVAEGMVTAEAAIGAVKEVALLAADALQQITVEGGRIAGVEQNFNRLSLAAGDLSDSLITQLSKGVHGTISDFGLMKNVNDELAAGVHLTSDQFNILSAGAFALAQAKGLDVNDAFERINLALETGRIRGVQYLTGKLDLAAAEEKYAATLGTTADRLTPLEKQEGARAAILDAVASATTRLGDQSENMNVKIQQVATNWDNFENKLGETVATSPVVLKAFDDIEKSLGEAFGTDKDALIKTIAGDIDSLATASVGAVHAGISLVQFTMDYKEVLEPLVVAVGAYYAAQLLTTAGTWALNAATTALTGGIAFLATPLGVVTVAAGAMYAAFEIGHWQPISDFFEKLGLEVFYGLGENEANAAVQATRLGQAQSDAAAKAKSLQDAENEIKLATQDWHQVLLTMDGSIVDWAEHLLSSGVSAKSVAAEYGLTDSQVKALQQDIVAAAQAEAEHAKALANTEAASRMSRQELKQYMLAWQDLNTIGGTYDDTLNKVNPDILESVKYYASVGASVKDLTAAFPGLTKVQAEAAVAGAKAALEIQKVWDQTATIIANTHGNDIDDWIANETRRYQETIKLLQQQHTATDEMLDAELAKHNAIVDQEIQKRAAQVTNSRAQFAAARDAAKAQLDLEITDYDDFTDAQRQAAERQFNEAESRYEHWAQIANSSLDAVSAHVKSLADTFQGRLQKDSSVVFDNMTQAMEAMDAGLDESKIKVTELDGEVISLKEAIDKLDSGGSFAVTSQNFGKTLESYFTSGGMNVNGEKDFDINYATKLAKLGYSYAEIIQIMQNNKTAMPNSTIPPPQGPRIPGFAEGGVGDFGSGMLAVLHGKEAIVPLNGSGGGLGDINLVFNVNGTGSQVAQTVKDILMRELKQVRQFPSS